MLSCRNKPSGSFFCRAYHFPAYLCGSKSCLTVKLSTTQVARLCSTQARNNITRAKIWKSILDKTQVEHKLVYFIFIFS